MSVTKSHLLWTWLIQPCGNPWTTYQLERSGIPQPRALVAPSIALLSGSTNGVWYSHIHGVELSHVWGGGRTFPHFRGRTIPFFWGRTFPRGRTIPFWPRRIKILLLNCPIWYHIKQISFKENIQSNTSHVIPIQLELSLLDHVFITFHFISIHFKHFISSSNNCNMYN